MDFEMMIGLLSQYSGPRFLVKFGTYYRKLLYAERMFYIGCCEENRLDELNNHMKELQCEKMHMFQGELYSNTEVNIKLVGRYQIKNQPLTFM